MSAASTSHIMVIQLTFCIISYLCRGAMLAFMWLFFFYHYAPNFEKVDGAYCFWSVHGCVRAWVTLFVPTVTFKPLKLES